MKQINEYIVEQAWSDYEAGHGEVGGDNRGPWILKIMRGISGAWCCAWVCDVIDRAWRQFDIEAEKMPVPNIWYPTYTRSARNLFNQFRAAGKLVDIPQPGDIIFMSRPGAPWMGHAAIITDKGKNVYMLPTNNGYTDAILTIQGNVGKYPAKLKVISYEDYRAVPRLLGYGRVG